MYIENVDEQLTKIVGKKIIRVEDKKIYYVQSIKVEDNKAGKRYSVNLIDPESIFGTSFGEEDFNKKQLSSNQVTSLFLKYELYKV